jgi:spore germination protein YaaH
MSAWVPAWDSKALASMQSNAGKLDEANPGWYTIAADGGVTKNSNAEAADMRAALAGIDLVPTIKNYVGGKFDGNLVANVVGSPTLREKHAEALTQLVVQNAYEGIDIDYESMNAAARPNFTLFVQLLAQKLHGAGKKLSVTVSAKTSDADNWSGPAGEDWRAIGAAADTVKIMAYDNHWDGSAAGAIAPLNWLDNIATYAEATMPAQKIIMGLPWYGYDWQGTNATDLVYSEAVALAQRVGAQIAYDANGEATFAYSGRTVYFQDSSSYAKKVDAILKKHPQIGGFAHWRAGGEDPAIWTDVARLHNSSSSGGTPVAGNFVIAGPTVLVAKAGQQSQVIYAVTSINGWSGIADVAVQQIDAFPGSLSVTTTARVGAPAVLTLTPNANAAPGQYRLKIRMTSGTIANETTLTVQVESSVNKRRSAHH